jgi:hypothetical protein
MTALRSWALCSEADNVSYVAVTIGISSSRFLPPGKRLAVS